MLCHKGSTLKPHKSTNDRFRNPRSPLLLALATLLVLPVGSVIQAGPAKEIGLYQPTRQAMAVDPELRGQVHGGVPDRGSDVKRLRHLRASLLVEETAPTDGPAFPFQFVGLARELGILSFFVAVDPLPNQSIRVDQLAAGVFDGNRIVVFEAADVRRPARHRVRPLGDRTATAVLLAGAGHDLLLAGDTKTAVDRLETAVLLDRSLDYAWRDLGIALRREGERERALDAYERSLQLAAVNSRAR